jgi:hypothetical protein
MLAIGDAAERLLRFFGVTKERVQAVVGKDCGCAKRQAAMNELGYRWQRRAMMPVYWLRDVPIYWVRWQWHRVRHYLSATRFLIAGRYLRLALRVLLFGR